MDFETAERYTIGELIKKHRKDHKLTQAELAKRINTSVVSYQRYEHDQVMPSIEKVEQIAKALDMDLISFFLYDGDFPIDRDKVNKLGGWQKDDYTSDLLLQDYNTCCYNVINGSSKKTKTNLDAIILVEFNQLNLNGKNEAIKRVKEMTRLEEYTNRPQSCNEDE